MLFIELPAIKLSYCYPFLVIFADTAYLWWCHWSGAVETVLNDSRKQRVIRNGVTVRSSKQEEVRDTRTRYCDVPSCLGK